MIYFTKRIYPAVSRFSLSTQQKYIHTQKTQIDNPRQVILRFPNRIITHTLHTRTHNICEITWGDSIAQHDHDTCE